jgi:excisionase family DNA binding protein
MSSLRGNFLSFFEDKQRVREGAALAAGFVALTVVDWVFKMGEGGKKTDKLFSVGEAARLLDMGETTLRDRIDRGEVRAVKLPSGRLKIEEQELQAFKEKRKV